MRTLQVDLGERSYPIHIGEGVLNGLAERLAERGITTNHALMIVSDEQVASFHLARTKELLERAGYRVCESVVPSGETSKSLAVMERVIGDALKGGLDRNSAIIALGGGVVGDLAGYAAASYMRGIRFVQIPTTILAHDSSVGGKVAVNHPLAKNIIGAFHQPELVLFDIELIRTLPEREVRNGYAEMVKHGLIWDAEFVRWYDDNARRLLALDAEAVEHALYVGCRIKSAVVSRDERENDLRAILNLGHTIGHAIEAVAGYGGLLHGEAISIGMVGAAMLAMRFGRPAHIVEETERLLSKFGLPTRVPAHMDTDRIMSAMSHDKKFRDGRTLFVLPTDIGSVELRRDVPIEWVRQTVDQLKED